MQAMISNCESEIVMPCQYPGGIGDAIDFEKHQLCQRHVALWREVLVDDEKDSPEINQAQMEKVNPAGSEQGWHFAEISAGRNPGECFSCHCVERYH